MKLTDLTDPLKKALKQFGENQFFDKGPHEVMDVPKLCGELRKLPSREAAALIVNLSKSGKMGHGEHLAKAIVGSLDDWDELFQEDGIEDLYD